jgi:hypothetical protein
MRRPSAEVEQVSDTSNLRFEGVEDKIEFHLPSVMYDNGGIVQDLGLFLWSMSKFWLWQVSLKKFNPLIFQVVFKLNKCRRTPEKTLPISGRRGPPP